MNLDDYNKQLKPCDRCKSSMVEIVKNENAVGVLCDACGNLFAFKNLKAPVSEN